MHAVQFNRDKWFNVDSDDREVLTDITSPSHLVVVNTLNTDDRPEIEDRDAVEWLDHQRSIYEYDQMSPEDRALTRKGYLDGFWAALSMVESHRLRLTLNPEILLDREGLESEVNSFIDLGVKSVSEIIRANYETMKGDQ